MLLSWLVGVVGRRFQANLLLLLLLSEEAPNRNDLLHQRSLLEVSEPLERGTGRMDDSDGTVEAKAVVISAQGERFCAER